MWEIKLETEERRKNGNMHMRNGRSIPNKAGRRRQWKKAGEDSMRVEVNGRDDEEREKKNMWIRECSI